MADSSKYFAFPLKPQQVKAFELLQIFVKDESIKAFILKGFAGTGKTTLMSGLIEWLEEQNIHYTLLASTGRAAKVLSNLTNAIAHTIHSQLYVFNDLSENLEELAKLQENYAIDDKGQLSLVFDLKPIHTENCNVYIIDESSMISDIPDKMGSHARYGSGELLKDILQFDKKGKFIFVGDPCQLPPINQVISPALSSDYLKNKYSIKIQEYELTDIIRQSKDSGIIEASFKLRRLYNTNPEVKFANLPVKGHNNIKLHNSHISILESYIQDLKVNGFEHSILLSQTNRHCSDLNRFIRSALNKNENHIESGDLIMITQNNYISRMVNGDQAIVKNTGSKEFRCGLSFLQVEVEELFSKNTYSLLMIEDILYSSATNLNSKQHKDLYIDFYYRMKELGIHQNERTFKDKMLTDPYLNALKAVYGYALTCHKSQGGEWNDVYLYLDNKIHGIPKPGIYQWWYTAITRAKERLHLVDDWFIR
jgi:ATP-dependent exoDNAse (exonuclease V) alpha subunit